MQLNAPRFRVNLKAIAKHCSQESAKLNECSAASRLGKGSLVVQVTTQTGDRTVTIPLTVYVHSRTELLAVAKVFGWQVVPGTLDTRHGLVVRFNPLPQGPPFPGVTYALKRFTLDIGARRTVSTRSGTVIKNRHVDLIRNPTTCKTSWQSSVLLTFTVGQAVPLATPTTCSKS